MQEIPGPSDGGDFGSVSQPLRFERGKNANWRMNIDVAVSVFGCLHEICRPHHHNHLTPSCGWAVLTDADTDLKRLTISTASKFSAGSWVARTLLHSFCCTAFPNLVPLSLDRFHNVAADLRGRSLRAADAKSIQGQVEIAYATAITNRGPRRCRGGRHQMQQRSWRMLQTSVRAATAAAAASREHSGFENDVRRMLWTFRLGSQRRS